MTASQVVVDIQQLARDLADALEGEWEVHPGYWGSDDALLRSAADGQLHVQRVHNAPRIQVSGSTRVGDEDLSKHWPTGKNYTWLRHEITVSAAKTAERIAREVERRLLPGYREALAQAREKKAAHDEREAATARLVAELAAILGGGVWERSPNVVQVGRYDDPTLHGTARVTSSDVEFELRVPREFAAAFAARVAATG